MHNRSYPRLAATALALAGSLAAQNITWGPVQITTGPADVHTNGYLVAAYNLQPDGSALEPTLNGVTFASGLAPEGWTIPVSTLMNGESTGTPGYDGLLDTARVMANGPARNPTGWGGIRLDELAPLVPGAIYQVQCWFTDQRTGTTQLNDREMRLRSAHGTATVSGGEILGPSGLALGAWSAPLDGDPNNTSGAGDNQFGSHCTGTFEYTPGAETWLVVEGSHPNSNFNLRPHLCAFQIREVYRESQITWGPVQTSTQASDVCTDGSLVVARNLRGSGAAATAVVNGVTFEGVTTTSGWSNPVTNMLQGSTTGDAGYDLLLSTAAVTTSPAGNPSPQAAIALTGLGLQRDRTYKIQCWFTDQRAGPEQLYDRRMRLVSAYGNGSWFNPPASQGVPSGPLDADPDNAPAITSPDTQFGSYCTGTFTFSDSATLFLVVEASHPFAAFNVRPHLNAFQIRDITSPASITDLGGDCGLTLTASSAPIQSANATAFDVETSGLPAIPTLHVGILGLTDPNFPGALLGMPGCTLHASLDVLIGPTLANGGNVGYTPLVVPALPPSLSGFTFYVQSAALGVPQNGAFGLGAIVSNGLQCVVGTQ